MVINSLFIIGKIDLKIFMEKHWCSAVKRMVMDEFLQSLKDIGDLNDLPIVSAAGPDHYLINIIFSDLIFVAVCREGKFFLANRKILFFLSI